MPTSNKYDRSFLPHPPNSHYFSFWGMSALKRKRRDELELTVGDEEAREKEKVAAKIVKKKAKKAEGKNRSPRRRLESW